MTTTDQVVNAELELRARLHLAYDNGAHRARIGDLDEPGIFMDALMAEHPSERSAMLSSFHAGYEAQTTDLALGDQVLCAESPTSPLIVVGMTGLRDDPSTHVYELAIHTDKGREYLHKLRSQVLSYGPFRQAEHGQVPTWKATTPVTKREGYFTNALAAHLWGREVVEL